MVMNETFDPFEDQSGTSGGKKHGGKGSAFPPLLSYFSYALFKLDYFTTAVMVCSAPDSGGANESVLQRALYREAMLSGMRLFSNDFYAYLCSHTARRISSAVNEDELKDYLTNSLADRLRVPVNSRFCQVIGQCRRRELPADMEAMAVRLHDTLYEGLVVRDSIMGDGKNVFFRDKKCIMETAPLLPVYKGLRRAVKAAMYESTFIIAWLVPELLESFFSEKFPDDDVSGLVSRGVEFLCAKGKAAAESDPPSGSASGKGKMTFSDLISYCFGTSRRSFERDLLALDALLWARRCRIAEGKPAKEADGPARTFLKEWVCSTDYVRQVVLDENPTYRDILARVDRGITDCTEGFIPASVLRDARGTLEEMGLLDAHVYDCLKPVRMKGKPTAEQLAEMKAARSEAYIKGLESAVENILCKLRNYFSDNGSRKKARGRLKD